MYVLGSSKNILLLLLLLLHNFFFVTKQQKTSGMPWMTSWSPREDIWRCTMECNVPEKYVNLIQDIVLKLPNQVRELQNTKSAASRWVAPLHRYTVAQLHRCTVAPLPRCTVAPRICLKSIPVPETHGCTNRRGEEITTRILFDINQHIKGTYSDHQWFCNFHCSMLYCVRVYEIATCLPIAWLFS